MGAGLFSMGLKLGTQVLVGCGCDSDDAEKSRRGLVEDEGFSVCIADGAAAFLDKEDSRCEVPLVFRLNGESGLDAAGGNQSQCVGDGVHGAASSGLGERHPAVVPELPGIDHDDRTEVMSGREGDACAVHEQSAAAHRGEEFVGRGIEDRSDDR